MTDADKTLEQIDALTSEDAVASMSVQDARNVAEEALLRVVGVYSKRVEFWSPSVHLLSLRTTIASQATRDEVKVKLNQLLRYGQDEIVLNAIESIDLLGRVIARVGRGRL